VHPAGSARREPLPWLEISRLLVERRKELGLSRREAARRAEINERAWKRLEEGCDVPLAAVRVVPNSTDAELLRIAHALDIEPEALLGPAPQRGATSDALTARIASLTSEDRRLVEQLVERLTRAASSKY
jgi:hypothetical protein